MDGLSDEVHGSKLETLHFIVQLIKFMRIMVLSP